jgi:hypothetical protein
MDEIPGAQSIFEHMDSEFMRWNSTHHVDEDDIPFAIFHSLFKNLYTLISPEIYINIMNSEISQDDKEGEFTMYDTVDDEMNKKRTEYTRCYGGIWIDIYYLAKVTLV